jgi:hypothetical protein
MRYLGTLAPPNLRQAKKQVGVASLPCVVLNDKGVPLGVVVASNPSFLGAALEPMLKEAGLVGPFTQVPPTKLDDAGKTSAARAIMRASDPQLDKAGALATFGYNPSMLA